MTEIIYIPLEDEGVSVRRPARGYRRPDGAYIVLRPADYDSAMETWTFPPGSIVECELMREGGRDYLAAVRSVAENESISGKQAMG